MVRLSYGPCIWANYWEKDQEKYFEPCDDFGNITGSPLNNVADVCAITDWASFYEKQ